MGGTDAGWHPDPYGRHQMRYYDGTRWTEHVASNGIQATENAPPAAEPADLATPSRSSTGNSAGRSVEAVSPIQGLNGEYVPGSDERNAAMWCHLGPMLVSLLSCGLLAIAAWIVPLVILNGKGRESPFVRLHATQSLNFFIEMFIAGFVSALLVVVVIGFVLFPIVVVWNVASRW